MFELSALGQELTVIVIICFIFILCFTFLLGSVIDFDVE